MKGGFDMNNRIKELRKSLGLNQTEFGEGINLSKSQIACYENGSRNVTDRSISDICEKYNVNEEWLRHGIGEMFKPEPEINELAYLMGMFISNNSEDELRTKIIKAMLSLDDDGWKFIEGLVERIAK
jgi:transcriptional regulator with XRE-family HTH domain